MHLEIQEEPHYRTQEELRKLDIVATMGTLGLVIDAQIVGQQSDLKRARTVKIRKYADNPDIKRAIQRETGATNIRHLPVIFSWRGIWCKASASDFLILGTIIRRDLAVSRVLIGGIIAHRDFNRSTGHVRKMKSPKEDHHHIPSVLPAVLRHNLFYFVYVISIKL